MGIYFDNNAFTEFLHFKETALTMIGKYGITASLAILVLYAGEIYPTTLRNEGLGLASTAGRIGGMVAPFAVFLVNLPSRIHT